MLLSTAGDAKWNTLRINHIKHFPSLSMVSGGRYSHEERKLRKKRPKVATCHPSGHGTTLCCCFPRIRAAALVHRVRSLLLGSQFQNRDRFHSQSYRSSPSTCPKPSPKLMSRWASPRNGTCFRVDARSDLIRCMRAQLFVGRSSTGDVRCGDGDVEFRGRSRLDPTVESASLRCAGKQIIGARTSKQSILCSDGDRQSHPASSIIEILQEEVQHLLCQLLSGSR